MKFTEKHRFGLVALTEISQRRPLSKCAAIAPRAPSQSEAWTNPRGFRCARARTFEFREQDRSHLIGRDACLGVPRRSSPTHKTSCLTKALILPGNGPEPPTIRSKSSTLHGRSLRRGLSLRGGAGDGGAGGGQGCRPGVGGSRHRRPRRAHRELQGQAAGEQG